MRFLSSYAAMGIAGKNSGARERSSLSLQLCLLAAVIVIFTISVFPMLGRPYLIGHDGFNGAFFSMGAVNTLRFGLMKTRGAPTRAYWGEVEPAKKDFYTSKPYGHPLLLAATYGLFGVSERVGRSLSFAFCLGFIVWLFFFGREFGAPLGGLVAAGAAASLPIIQEFGPMLTGQIPSLPFILGLYLVCFRGLRDGHFSADTIAGLFICLLCAGLLDWHVFTHLPGLMVYFAWVHRREPARLFRFWLLISLAALLPLVLFALHTQWLDGFDYLLTKLRQRTGLAPAVTFTWLEFFERQWKYLCLMYRRPTILIALVGLLLPASGAAGWLQRAGRLSAVSALAESLLLNEAIYIHIYYTFVWALPTCFALASLAQRLAEGGRSLLVGAVATVLLAALFGSSADQVRSSAEMSARQSLPLITIAQELANRLKKQEKVVLYMGQTQFSPQILYYLRHQFSYSRNAWQVNAIARRCAECRFVVMKAGNSEMPNAKVVREAFIASYPHELRQGYYIFTLPERPGTS